MLIGIGSFVIIDHERITAEDAGSNFFLDLNCIGESKAKVCTSNIFDYCDSCIDCLIVVLLLYKLLYKK